MDEQDNVYIHDFSDLMTWHNDDVNPARMRYSPQTDVPPRTPEQKVWLAVLRQAVADRLKPEACPEDCDLATATPWLFHSEDMEDTCAHLGIDPEGVRKRLKQVESKMLGKRRDTMMGIKPQDFEMILDYIVGEKLERYEYDPTKEQEHERPE